MDARRRGDRTVRSRVANALMRFRSSTVQKESRIRIRKHGSLLCWYAQNVLIEPISVTRFSKNNFEKWKLAFLRCRMHDNAKNDLHEKRGMLFVFVAVQNLAVGLVRIQVMRAFYRYNNCVNFSFLKQSTCAICFPRKATNSTSSNLVI